MTVGTDYTLNCFAIFPWASILTLAKIHFPSDLFANSSSFGVNI